MAFPFAGFGVDFVCDSSLGFVEFLEQRGFSNETRRRHIGAFRGFCGWLRENGAWPIDLQEVTRSYVESRTDVCAGTRKGLRFGLNRFLQYLAEDRGFAFPDGEQDVFEELRRGFADWLVQVRNLSMSTVDLRLGYLKRFLAWSAAQGFDSLGELVRKNIEDFFIAAGKLGFGRSFKRSLQATLRQFLSFCFEQGHCPRDLSGSVPSYRSYRLAQAPRAIREEDVLQLLAGMDRDSPSAIRDYAIIRLLYEYGVRGVQIRLLRLADIDWHAEEIFFAAVKGGKSCRFPLSPDAGNAVLAYLKVRPQLSTDRIFLTLRAPYSALRDSNTISEIVRRRLREQAIASPVTGAHGFRHAFAARLLRRETPFKHMADLMGHRHIQTTFIYTKIDFTALSAVGLELPEAGV